MRAFLLIHVKAFTVVTAYALTRHDLRASNRAPFALLLADFARIALGPALDPEYGEI